MSNLVRVKKILIHLNSCLILELVEQFSLLIQENIYYTRMIFTTIFSPHLELKSCWYSGATQRIKEKMIFISKQINKREGTLANVSFLLKDSEDIQKLTICWFYTILQRFRMALHWLIIFNQYSSFSSVIWHVNIINLVINLPLFSSVIEGHSFS